MFSVLEILCKHIPGRSFANCCLSCLMDSFLFLFFDKDWLNVQKRSDHESVADGIIP